MNRSVEDGTEESPGGGRSREDMEIRRYLLGEGFSDEDREEIEERLSEDGALFERMRLLEDELVDDYVLEKLTEGERRLFETHFLSTPGRVHSVKLALAFAAVAAERAEEKAPEPAPPDWLGKLRDRLKIPGDLFALVLMPQAVRGAAGGEAREAPAGARPMQLILLLEDDLYESYRAELRAPGGETLVKEGIGAGETEAGLAVVLELPQGLAAPGEYSVMLSGKADGAYDKVGIYSFNAK